MSQTAPPSFSSRGSTAEIEHGATFMPKFDADGLIGAIVTDHVSGNVLMFAYMNETALQRTLASGEAYFWSRSRGRLWRKGEESGNTLSVRDIRTDCDQDVLWLRVHVSGAGVACHTGASSCFYRRLAIGGPAADTVVLNPVDTTRD